MKDTLTILEDKFNMCLKIISLIHLIELYHNLFPICSMTVSIFKSCILILTTILMSVYDLPFFSGKWSWVDFSFPRIPGMQLFMPNMNRNNTHPFQDRSYMQLIGLFYVPFFSICLATCKGPPRNRGWKSHKLQMPHGRPPGVYSQYVKSVCLLDGV